MINLFCSWQVNISFLSWVYIKWTHWRGSTSTRVLYLNQLLGFACYNVQLYTLRPVIYGIWKCKKSASWTIIEAKETGGLLTWIWIWNWHRYCWTKLLWNWNTYCFVGYWGVTNCDYSISIIILKKLGITIFELIVGLKKHTSTSYYNFLWCSKI